MATQGCPCGYHGSGARPCQCLDTAVMRYRARVSGPLLDRIDLHVNVPRLEFAELEGSRASESSSTVRERVLAAAERRAQLPPADARALAEPVRRLLARASERLALSARAVGRVVSVAATIACLAGRTEVSTSDVAEALQYRPDPGFEHASHLDIGTGRGAQ